MWIHAISHIYIYTHTHDDAFIYTCIGMKTYLNVHISLSKSNLDEF